MSKILPRMHIVVLMGGWSRERAISLMSGADIACALESRNHTVTCIDMDRNVAEKIATAAPDIVFNALHGCPGEDGTVQGMLDVMGIDYTHSGMVASAITIDKELTKARLTPHAIPMPKSVLVQSQQLLRGDPLPRPYVVKPIREGSSLGVAIIREDSVYGQPIAATAEGPWQDFDYLLAEPFIRGRELTVAVLGERVLGVTELKPKRGFYDYQAKYTDGLTDHIYPAAIPADIAEYLCDIALRAHHLLGCESLSRADFRWDECHGRAGVFLLEVNSQPGMTPLSLVPEQARHCGICYADLVEYIVEDALKRPRSAEQKMRHRVEE